MPAAVAIPSIISAGTSIVGGVLGSRASKNAAKIQQQGADQAGQLVADAVAGGQKGVGDAAADASKYVNSAAGNANDLLKQIYESQLGFLNPYQAAGSDAVTKLSDLTPFAAPTAEEAEATPGYRFTLAQGMKALQSSQAAKGLTGSSGALKSLMQYNKGLADTTYNDVFNRNLTTYSTNAQRLKDLAGFGTTANDQAIRAGTTYGTTASGNTMQAGLFEGNTTNQAAQFGANLGLEGARLRGDYITGGANATAAGTVGAANAWGTALTGIGNAANIAGTGLTLRSMYPNLSAPQSFTPYDAAKPWTGLPTAAAPGYAALPPVSIPTLPPGLIGGGGATPSMGSNANLAARYRRASTSNIPVG